MTDLFWEVHPACLVQVQSNDERLTGRLSRIFAGRLVDQPIPEPMITCSLHLAPDYLPPPDHHPWFIDNRLGSPSMLGNVAVHGEGEYLTDQIVHFSRVGQASYSPAKKPTRVEITFAPQIFGTGKFEDVIFTALAPLLRRCGVVLVHAFAAVEPHSGRAILLVGRSGSGKTTTGLNLLLHGWRLLGNDLIVLGRQGGQVWGYPTPGIVTIRQPTFDLLPRLRALADQVAAGIDLTSDQLAAWADPQPISAIYFPEIHDHPHSERLPSSQALALAWLMEESVDRWDRGTLVLQTDLLSQLVRQSEHFTLHLGRNMSEIPNIV